MLKLSTRDASDLIRIMKKYKPDYVIHRDKFDRFSVSQINFRTGNAFIAILPMMARAGAPLEFCKATVNKGECYIAISCGVYERDHFGWFNQWRLDRMVRKLVKAYMDSAEAASDNRNLRNINKSRELLRGVGELG